MGDSTASVGGGVASRPTLASIYGCNVSGACAVATEPIGMQGSQTIQLALIVHQPSS